MIKTGYSVKGGQWGDEGKAKIVDYFTWKLLKELEEKMSEGEYIAFLRYYGGGNAGHTTWRDGKKRVFHLLPAGAGVISPYIINLITRKVVVKPEGFFGEYDDIVKFNPDVKVFIDSCAMIVNPLHGFMDKLREHMREKKIGTTGQGIGPAYGSLAQREKFLAYHFCHEPEVFLKALKSYLKDVRKLAARTGLLKDVPSWNFLKKWHAKYSKRLKPFLANTRGIVQKAKAVLGEGAHGAMLDLHNGTYPFVTSSSCSRASMTDSVGCLDGLVEALAIKAYTTRVGGGPFPTELSDEDGDNLQSGGDEFGATTKRKRRCGWFDAAQVKDVLSRMEDRIKLFLTKLDVLTGFKEIKICTGYEGVDLSTDIRPIAVIMEKAVPIYETHPGWPEKITDCTEFDQFPENAQKYVKRIGELLGKSMSWISVGPDTMQTIEMD